MLQPSDSISFLYSCCQGFDHISGIKGYAPFDSMICTFLSKVSSYLLKLSEAKVYPDVMTFAFWCRRANLEAMKKDYEDELRLGRGIVFHIAPSNVPVNFAYSLVAGLLAGNANIVRVPSKPFPQVELIVQAFSKVLEEEEFCALRPFITLIRYEHNHAVNEYVSSLCDVRVIWGGDSTIQEIRKAALPPRAFDITFADRYSICAIQADEYLKLDNPEKLALDFYNDTFLFDQNACTAPHLVVWTGEEEAISKAQELFWTLLHRVAEQRYTLMPIQSIDKLTAFYKSAVHLDIYKESMPDNLIVRAKMRSLVPDLEEYRCYGGYFLEYSASALDELAPIISAKYQTLSYYGYTPEALHQFVKNNNLRGIDRIVPIGKTLDFTLIWDGYDLIHTLSRKMSMV